MGMSKIKKGDTVQVLAGKDKGRVGAVKRIVPGKKRKTRHGFKVSDNKIVVEGVNIVTKHVKPQGEQKPGGIEKREAPLAISNVGLFNPITKKPDRVAFKVLEDGRKIRLFKSSGEPVDV